MLGIADARNTYILLSSCYTAIPALGQAASPLLLQQSGKNESEFEQCTRCLQKAGNDDDRFKAVPEGHIEVGSQSRVRNISKGMVVYCYRVHRKVAQPNARS